MKNILILILIFSTLTSGACAKTDAPTQPKKELPPKLIELISITENVAKEKIRILPESIFSWEQGYIFGVSMDDNPKSCYIYTFIKNELNVPFSYAPCEFYGPPETHHRHGETNPDLIYKTSIASPHHSVSVQNLVAFAFDKNKKNYCESKSLALWYQSGNRNIPVQLSDMICPGQ